MAKNCSILSQKVPKFELYKHNDELFNIYYRIFYELWTFAYLDRLCKLEKRGDEILKKISPLKLLSQSQPNFAEMILGWSSSKIMSGVIWYFEPHGKLNQGLIYLWYFDPGFNFPYGILTPGSIFCHCILNPLMVNWTPLHFYQKRSS